MNIILLVVSRHSDNYTSGSFRSFSFNQLA